MVSTDTGGFLGQPPTGRPFRVFVVRLCDVADGKIIRERRVFDVNGLLLQLAKGDGVAGNVPRSYRDALAAARLEHEIRIAAEIQRALLPAPHHRTLGVEVAASSLPCREIGGDFFDYFAVSEGAFGFVLGDVSGKGPPAALLAAQMQGLVAAYATTGHGPAETFSLVNRELIRRHLESRFATLFFGVLSPSGRLTYCNAGHNPPLVVGSGQRRLDAASVPVGLLTDAAFHDESVQLDLGDVLVAFSDGVVEALDCDGGEYGESRLLSSVSVHEGVEPPALLERIMTTVREFAAGAEQHDDMTALVLRFDRTAAVSPAVVAAV